jgi:GAF domain-containing protein
VDARLKGGPDPAVRLQAFVDRVRGRISPVEPHQVSRCLVDEAVGAFCAKGGAVYWQSDGRLKLIYRTVDWDGDPRVSADLGSDLAHRMGVVALGTRRNGEEYSENHKQVLQEVASAIAQAIEQDRPQA